MIESLNMDNFEAFIGRDGLTVVDFFATWCMPCRMMAPIVEAAAEKYAGRVDVGKIDVDECTDLALNYDIHSIPCVLFFKKGEEVHRIVGLTSEENFYDALEEHA